MAERALRISPPKPAYVSMPNAVRAAILSGNSLSDIVIPRWASTYCTSEEAIKEAWEAELSRQTQHPINSYEVDGK